MYKKIVNIIASNSFFWLVWVLSIVQAAWIALISRYPMAFDEAHHYEVIKIHAKQWGPLILKQPDGPVLYGPLVRDPSYLYHYLLSFPYRLLDSLGLNDHTIIISMRFISIVLFAIGLLLFRKVLKRTKASNAAINAAMLFFIMIPTVPLLAGQLNYDNLQFPLMALAMLMTINFRDSLQKRKVDLFLLSQIIVVCVLGSVTKFTYLPVITAIVLYLAFILIRFYRGNSKLARRAVKKDWFAMSTARRWVLSGTLAVVTGLFLWSYGVNLVLYRNPVPPCHTVLGKERCSENEIWLRNDTAALNNKGVNPNPVLFSYNWLNGMHYRLFFTINGASGAKRYQNHTALGITTAAAVLAIIGGLLFLRYGRRIFGSDPALVFIVFVSLFYIGSVWARNYNDFLNLGKMLAINGRYMQPLLLPVIFVLIASYQWALRTKPNVKLAILLVSFLLFLSGGGIIGFIHYSDTDWYITGNQLMLSINDFARKIVAPLFLWQ
jgi:hypothetical protein